MASDDDPDQKVQGTVKWFDPSKGFGFIVATNDGPDILAACQRIAQFRAKLGLR